MKLFLVDTPDVGVLLIRAKNKLSAAYYIMEKFFNDETIINKSNVDKKTYTDWVESQIYLAVFKGIEFDWEVEGQMCIMDQYFLTEEEKQIT